MRRNLSNIRRIIEYLLIVTEDQYRTEILFWVRLKSLFSYSKFATMSRETTLCQIKYLVIEGHVKSEFDFSYGYLYPF